MNRGARIVSRSKEKQVDGQSSDNSSPHSSCTLPQDLLKKQQNTFQTVCRALRTLQKYRQGIHHRRRPSGCPSDLKKEDASRKSVSILSISSSNRRPFCAVSTKLFIYGALAAAVRRLLNNELFLASGFQPSRYECRLPAVLPRRYFYSHNQNGL